jgi:trans-aconitate methyltransferase
MGEYGEDYARYQLERSWLRKLVRRIYLQSAALQLKGATVDLGCGVGELLSRLPGGSIGLDINPVSIAHCRQRGLEAHGYDGEADGWSLNLLEGRTDLQSLVVSHVLEHLDEPMDKLSRLLEACTRVGIQRVLVIVPGRRGFASDATHRTFIDAAMLSAPSVTGATGFSLTSTRHFPINIAPVSKVFTHLELQAIFDRRSEAAPA